MTEAWTGSSASFFSKNSVLKPLFSKKVIIFS
jgi:hypothetical protein